MSREIVKYELTAKSKDNGDDFIMTEHDTSRAPRLLDMAKAMKKLKKHWKDVTVWIYTKEEVPT